MAKTADPRGGNVFAFPSSASYIREQIPLDNAGGGGGSGSGGPAGGDGMDGWQNSVEKRLDSLDRRLTTIESSVGDIRVDVATIKTDVAHLPSKSFIVTSVMGGLTAISIIVGIAANWDRLRGPTAPQNPPAIVAPTNQS